jgi:ketosteroid isomerase-like protein
MSNQVQEIRDLEERRRVAMLAGDIATLDSLLAEQLAYTHSNAEVDSKASYLKKLGDKHFDYRTLAFIDQDVQIVGDVALVTGRMTADVILAGTAKKLNNQTTMIWVRQYAHWKLLSFQSTPFPTV